MPYRLTQKQLGRSIRTSLRRKLSKPERKVVEDQFEVEHESDTDTELYEYLKNRKRRLGRRMTPESTVGYLYCIKRLGPWAQFMARINMELAEEKMALRYKNSDLAQHLRTEWYKFVFAEFNNSSEI
jgi:hypothetical protein